MGMPLNQHWCGGELYSQQLYGAADQCGMEEMDAASGSATGEAASARFATTNHCCDDYQQLLALSGIENDGPLAPTLLTISAVAPLLLHLSTYNSAAESVRFAPLAPPLRVERDLVILHRALLI